MKLLKQFWILILLSLLLLGIVKSELVKRDYVFKRFHFYPIRVVVSKSIFFLNNIFKMQILIN